MTISERKYKITISNGYRQDGSKISKAKTIDVPKSVRKSGIKQYVNHLAEELEREFKYGYCEDGEMSFQNYAERWFNRQTTYAPSTLASYQSHIKVVCEVIGQIPLNKLRPITMEHLCAELRKREYHGNLITEQTVQKYISTVSVILSDAKRNEIIPKNPARMILLPRILSKQQVIPTEKEINFLMGLFLLEEFHYQVYFLLMLYTGCRRGELCALQWGDFNGYELTISKSLGYIKGKGLQIGKTKNGKTRTLGFDRAIGGVVNQFQNSQAKRGISVTEKDFVFVNDKNNPISPNNFTKKLREIYDKNGFSKEYHLHTLRHYFVTHLLGTGESKQTVADIVGHADTSFLERTYCHPQFEHKMRATDSVPPKLFDCFQRIMIRETTKWQN